MYLVVRNTTTNETYKWKDFKKALQYMNTVKAEEKEQEQTAKNTTSEKGSVRRKGGETREDSRSGSGSGSGSSEQKRKPMIYRGIDWSTLAGKKMENKYNRGFIRNMWEVIYPPSSRNK